jgi:hypothetical protein
MSPLSSLCVECGLCCDGSLFRFVPAEPSELLVWASLGLPIVTQSNRPAMALPCLKLEAKCCTVYRDRPSGCRAFVCHLGHRLTHGAVDFSRALALVKEAQRRIAVLQARWPVAYPVVQTATALARAGQAPSNDALDALEAVHSFLDQHVHWPTS